MLASPAFAKGFGVAGIALSRDLVNTSVDVLVAQLEEVTE